MSTAIVTVTDNVIKMIVNTRYLPSNGIANEVGGMISMRTNKKKTNDSKIDIVSDT